MSFLANHSRAILATLLWLFLAGDYSLGDEYGTATFSPEQFVEYEQQLNAILKTRRDEEKEFVSRVVRQVRLGKIPSKLVSTSYGWVRNKRPNTNYPFIYFEKVLRLQAKAVKLEAEIPPFDLSIYRSAGQATGRKSNSVGQRASADRQLKPSRGRR
ncbi:MAG: hypothetical protein P8J27_08400 [Mariniblastus sp.]|nr:hypothetical protein [Mariniblastus sp.]